MACAKDKDKTELAQYLHACAFPPSISTFQESINNDNFVTWPGIRGFNSKILLKTTEATLKGHIDQERQNLQSTKQNTQQDNDNTFLLKDPEKYSIVFILFITLII